MFLKSGEGSCIEKVFFVVRLRYPVRGVAKVPVRGQLSAISLIGMSLYGYLLVHMSCCWLSGINFAFS